MGPLVNCKPHGKGTYTLASGDVYKGDFVAGVFQGSGVYTFKAGGSYEGQFENGQYSGHGVYKTSDVEYDGQW